MKSLDTLVTDIYGLFDGSTKGEFTEEATLDFGHTLANIVKRRVEEATHPKENALRMSNIGTPCKRKLWYQVNLPEFKEALRPATHIKFLLGDIVEQLVLYLAKVAGHKVEGEQDELSVEGIKGHRDAIVDGIVVDVKSASSRSFDKFRDHLTSDNDSFGYIEQLNAYLEGSKSDNKVRDPTVGAFLAVDKQMGSLALDVHPKQEIDYPKQISELKATIALDKPPARPFDDVPDGKSGNRKLHTVCSYCEFKKKCWPNVRTFLYAGGPRYLTVVERLPNVPEEETTSKTEE